MKKPKLCRALSLFLIFVFAFSLCACSSREEPVSDDSSIASGTISDIEASSDASETEPSSTPSEEFSEEASAEVSSEASSEESSSLSSEASSEAQSSLEISSEEPTSEEFSSAEPSSDEPSSEDAPSSTEKNPWEGTNILPAEGKVVAFTFDDGPSYTDSTKKILDKLEELGMSATFFVVGERVSAGMADTIKRMIDLGCDIGNHSYNHPNFNQMTYAQVKKQIDDTNALLEKHVGIKATMLRPPYGNLPTSYMSKLNIPTICWNVDSLDWELKNAQAIYDRTISRISNGSIVLMHDIYNFSADAFCMLADKLVSEGYTLVSISQLLGTEKLLNTEVKYGFQW